MTIEKNMIDALIQHQVYSYRASTAVVNELFGDFVKSSNGFASTLRGLIDELTDAEKDALLIGKYTTATLKEIKQEFDLFYQSIAVTMPETFAVSAVALATYESLYISQLYGSKVELDGSKTLNKAKKAPIVGGQLFDEVWKNLAQTTKDKALYRVREGIQNGLTTAQIIAEIKGKRTKMADGSFEYVGGVVNEERYRIESAVRTIRNHVAQVAYENTFSVLGFEYVKFVATIDFRVSKVCGSLDGTVWKSTSDSIRRPPLHFNCRSVLIGCDRDGKIDGLRPFVADKRSVKNIPKDERDGIIGQIDANETFSKWLNRQPKAFQLEYLGKTKFKLYSDGSYSLDKFIDPLGNPYTIAELRALDQKTFKELGL